MKYVFGGSCSFGDSWKRTVPGRYLMQDVRQILADFQNGVAGVAESSGAVVDAFMGLQNAAFADGALSVKMKELISVAIGVYNRCQYCIVVHVYNAYQAGAKREEIL